VVTVPGELGQAAAFAGEMAMTAVLMTVVLRVGNSRLARLTGLCAGGLVALYIAVEAPLSGMSMNPARTLASAVPASNYTGWWIYFTAPLLGMFLAAGLYARKQMPVHCAKIDHSPRYRCIFCGYTPPSDKS
jgi:aquaporin Z